MKAKIWMALISVYIVWGSTYLAIRFAVQTIPPFLMAGTRQLTAGLILYLLMRRRGLPRPTRKQWAATAVVGLFLLLGGNGLVSWAEVRVPSSVTAIIVGSVPLWIVILDAVRPHGIRPMWPTVVGILIGFVGILVLIDPLRLRTSEDSVDMIGALALLVASLCWAIGSIYSREHHSEMPKQPLLGSGMEMLVGGAALLAIGTLSGEWASFELANISTSSLIGMGYLIFFGSLVGYASYSWLLGVAPTALVSTYAYVNPLVAVIMGSLIANEEVNFRVILATLLIVGGVIIINTSSWLRASGRLRTAQGGD